MKKLKKLFLACLLMAGCAKYTNPNTANPYNEIRKVTLVVTIGKYDNEIQCESEGGTWIVGNTAQFENAIVGCVEPPPKAGECMAMDDRGNQISVPCKQ